MTRSLLRSRRTEEECEPISDLQMEPMELVLHTDSLSALLTFTITTPASPMLSSPIQQSSPATGQYPCLAKSYTLSNRSLSVPMSVWRRGVRCSACALGSSSNGATCTRSVSSSSSMRILCNFEEFVSYCISDFFDERPKKSQIESKQDRNMGQFSSQQSDKNIIQVTPYFFNEYLDQPCFHNFWWGIVELILFNAIEQVIIISEGMLNLMMLRCRFAALKDIYAETIASRSLRYDDQQAAIVDHLQRLNDQIVRSHPAWKRHAASIRVEETPSSGVSQIREERRPGGFFSSLFRRQFSTGGMEAIRGVYLHGGSGCGKSFLSDLFYQHLPVQEKERQHFHEFMGGVHAELFELERKKKGYDPLVKVAANRASKTRLLYLDEFQVNDVADASILKRLFENLLQRGVVLLATSNRHPTDLYKNGHQREFFVPFIDLLQQKCDILHLESPDYRMLLERSADSKDTTYITPCNDKNLKRFKKVFTLVAGHPGEPKFTPVELEPVKGRTLVVQKADGGACLFDFAQLMEAVMGDTDYRAICKHFKAIFITNMRKISRNERNIANRLIKLFDEAYFRHVKVYILADTPLEQLIVPIENPQNEEDFALTRCHSRLIEFQTKSYKETLSYCETDEAKEQKY